LVGYSRENARSGPAAWQKLVDAFVDDYATGALPGVCIITGEPTADRLMLRTTVDRPSPGWLILLLLGPIGWLILLGVLLLGHRSILHGGVPMTAVAHEANRCRRTMRTVVALAGVVTAFALVFATPLAGFGLVVGRG
jgi:hypothetical protein